MGSCRALFVSGNCLVHLIAVDVIGILYNADFVCIHFTDDTDSKSRTWEWLTENKIFRNAKFKTCFADFVFEQVAEWLNDLFEINEIRKSSYVVVGFDHCGFTAKTTFHYVWIDGSLCKEINSSNFLCFLFKYTDEFLSDDFTFLFRLCNACKFVVVSLLCIDTDEV